MRKGVLFGVVMNFVGVPWTTDVEMSSSLRTDPKVYDDKKQKHLKGSTQKL
jgi:hypothetical protein